MTNLSKKELIVAIQGRYGGFKLLTLKQTIQKNFRSKPWGTQPLWTESP